MKYYNFLFILLLFSCNEDVSMDSGAIELAFGRWELIETFQSDSAILNPIFEPVDIKIWLEINEDGFVSANGMLCEFSQSEIVITGFYSLEENSILTECLDGTRTHQLSFSDNDLILSYSGCKEICQAKFERT